VDAIEKTMIAVKICFLNLFSINLPWTMMVFDGSGIDSDLNLSIVPYLPRGYLYGCVIGYVFGISS
jgi:hypothetical protein